MSSRQRGYVALSSTQSVGQQGRGDTAHRTAPKTLSSYLCEWFKWVVEKCLKKNTLLRLSSSATAAHSTAVRTLTAAESAACGLRMFLDVEATVGKLTSAPRSEAASIAANHQWPLCPRWPFSSHHEHHLLLLLLNTLRLDRCRHWGSSRTQGHFASVILWRVLSAEFSITSPI